VSYNSQVYREQCSGCFEMKVRTDTAKINNIGIARQDVHRAETGSSNGFSRTASNGLL